MMERVSIKDEKLVAAVKRLYFLYKGGQHKRITKEIKAAGWRTFSQSVLGTNRNGERRIPGWIERFGWRQELERRKKLAAAARARRIRIFEDWLKTHGDGMKWDAPLHRFICGQLKRITDGEVKRLMLFVPPRHGKSELVTVRYAAWRLARNPKTNIIIGSYNQKLANRFSRKIKKIALRTEDLAKIRQRADEWETVSGGGVKAVGVGAGITGFGGSLIIIDDPVKSRAQADSRTYREKTWDWYKDDVHTRLEPGGAVILIQTRWHDDDLAGRLLKDMERGGETWEVIKLPALAERNADTPVRMSAKHEQGPQPLSKPAEPHNRSADNTFAASGDADKSVRAPADPLGRDEGEALWPERFGRDELLAIKRRLGSRSFASLYQQRPHAEGGGLFKAEWFRNTVDKHPDGLRWVRGYDLAATAKNSSDHTASFRCAIDKQTGMLYIADGYRKRIEYPAQKRFVIGRMLAEPDTMHGIELAANGHALVQDLRSEASVIGRPLRGVKVSGDKLMRAEIWAALAEEGKVTLVNGPWIDDFLDEVCRFTGRGDAHDDQVDAVSIAVQMMRTASGFASF